MNTITIEVVTFDRVASNTTWWGFVAYDSYAEAFGFEAESEDEFRKMYPDTQSIVRKVGELPQFEDVDFANLQEAQLCVLAPEWMEVNHRNETE